jgi:hypothetical protein
MRPPREDTLPWYKQFWPWFIISLPGTVVIASIITITIAVKTNDGLVSDDYYKEGRAIHKTAYTAAKARALGIEGELAYEAETGAIRLRLQQPLPDAAAGLLMLDIIHPTLPNRDQSISLTPAGGVEYVGRAEPMGPAPWKIELHPEDKSWRISGRLNLPDATVARIN